MQIATQSNLDDQRHVSLVRPGEELLALVALMALVTLMALMALMALAAAARAATGAGSNTIFQPFHLECPRTHDSILQKCENGKGQYNCWLHDNWRTSCDNYFEPLVTREGR